MYNHYIPQSDGTHRRSPVQEASTTFQPISHKPECPSPPPRHHDPKPYSSPGGSVGTFLRQLLPRDFDIADLIVVLLLLLMASDKQEDSNSALLTLALYLFL